MRHLDHDQLNVVSGGTQSGYPPNMGRSALLLGLALTACGASAVDDVSDSLLGQPQALCDWNQAFGTPDHGGMACPEQKGMRVVATIVQDADADAENAESGFLQFHESSPLTSGDFLVVPSHAGYLGLGDRSADRWSLQALRWVPSVSAPGAILTPAWTAPSSWQPTDSIIQSFGYVTNGYVAQFGPAISGKSVYTPERFGRVSRRRIDTGAAQAAIDPLAGTPFSGDERVIVNSALSVDRAGNVYYTVVAWPTGDVTRSTLQRGSWLVVVHPDDTFRLVDWATIATSAVGVPQTRDLCEYAFGVGGTPAATGPDSKPPMFACGTQRPAMNAPVAIGDDGNLAVFSYANNAQAAAYIIRIDGHTLAPISAQDTRGRLHYGCGVRLGLDFEGGSGTTCDLITAHGTTNIGNDPDFNGAVRFRGEDLMDSAPTIAPNGNVSIGSYDGGFSFGGDYDARGGGVVFTPSGALAAVNETFFWEVTESVIRRPDGSFSYLQDSQRYSDVDLRVAQYTPAMVLQNSAAAVLDGTVAIDFLDAHITFGPGGDHYSVNGDGHLYKITAAGVIAERVPLPNDDGSIRSMEGLSGYQARDRAGRIYASYAGRVFVIASSGAGTTGIDPSPKPHGLVPSTPTLRAGLARASAAHDAVMPEPPGGAP